MSLVVADSEVKRTVDVLTGTLENMACICDDLARVLREVTTKGGGLDSSAIRAAMMTPIGSAKQLATDIRNVKDGLSAQAGSYVADIDGIDSYLY